jgi:alpha-glucosidase
MIRCLLAILPLFAVAQKQYSISSPDKSIRVQVTIADSIYYELTRNGTILVGQSAISFTTDQGASRGWKVTAATPASYNGTLTPVVWQKSRTVEEKYNALHIDFSNKLSLEWKVFNEGIGWRWIGNGAGPYNVMDEQAAINLGAEAASWYPREDEFFSHNERKYIRYKVGEIDNDKLASLPVLFEVNATKLLLTESGLFNYAGMWVRGDGQGRIRAVFPHYPKEKKIEGDRSEKVVSREGYIAKVDGRQEFPWRILMVEREDKNILANQLPYLLGRPQEAGSDFSWVKPGKVQWDWWHYNNVYNVPFRAGINNDTYKYYIDFSSANHIEYVLLDEGWCDTRDLMKQSKEINVKELVGYARQRNVGILLWSSWLVLDQQLDMALDSFASWGVKGIKVDFMQRDDQDMVNYYEKVAKSAAKRRLMVDFHGAYKPTGWSRTYPNVMTSEGVLGNEISKFGDAITPGHTLTIPFIRMAAGPMDFTPGGMRNVQKNAFHAVPSEPMTLGTRCNQLAMYVMYESPLQMLCDIPTHYMEEKECMEFLKAVPAVWQRTVPLEGKVGEWAAVARQAADGKWYIGAMTDWTPRTLDLSLDFLSEGEHEMRIWKDGPNADRNARDYQVETVRVKKGDKTSIKMAPGGGYVAIIK